MQRVFLIIVMALTCISLLAETLDKVITARRGDTWATLAKPFDIDPELLKEINGGLPECYVGMQVTIPGELLEEIAERKRIEEEERIDATINHDFERAANLANTGSLKEAKKIVDGIIALRPSADAYMMRGKIEYNRSKWSSAMEDFSRVMNRDDATAEMVSDARGLYNQASQAKAEADAEKSEMIGQLLGMAGMVAGQVAQGIAMNNAQKQVRKVDSSVSAPRRSSSVTSPSSSRTSSRSSVSRSSSSSGRSYGSSRSSSSSRSYSKERSSSSHKSYSSRSSSSSYTNAPSSNYSSRAKSTGYSRSSSPSTNNRTSKRYTPYNGSSTSSARTDETNYSANIGQTSPTWEKIQAQAEKYFKPENFVANYMAGRPTMPTSKEMGLTGMDAYAYDLETRLLYQTQEMDQQAYAQTQALVAKGMEQAQEEISNFSSIYGREPTAEEIDMIYKKYTQGYIDAYTTYVEEGIKTNKELGLGEIDRTKISEDKDNDNGTTTTESKKEEKPKKVEIKKENTVEKPKNKTKEKETPKNKHEVDNTGRYKQYKTGVFDYATKHRLYTGKVYQGPGGYNVEVNGTHYKANKTSKPGFSHSIVIGSKEYFLTIPLNL